jgi:hypothetical protein
MKNEEVVFDVLVDLVLQDVMADGKMFEDWSKWTPSGKGPVVGMPVRSGRRTNLV